MAPRKIALLTDSCADLSARAAEENRIHVVPLRIRCADGEYRDGVDIHAADIYARLKRGELPKTSLPTGEDIAAAFDRIAEQGYDGVIGMTGSSPSCSPGGSRAPTTWCGSWRRSGRTWRSRSTTR